MKKNKARALLACLGIALAGLIVACGGGDPAPTATEDPVAETERQRAQGLFDKLPVSWAPTKLVFDLNPGASQAIPVTLTTTKALKNARIVFVPDLRNAVTVSPETIPALVAGQSATVTLTFAPAASDKRKHIAGIVLLYDKNATVSQPLPVKVSLVKPETINGVVIPPAPPPELNDATLAGFDANGNGVRDDVERLLALKVSSPSQFAAAVAVGAAYQRAVVGSLLSQADADAYMLIIACAQTSPSLTTRDVQRAVLNTQPRAKAFRAVTSQFGGRAIDPSEDCR